MRTVLTQIVAVLAGAISCAAADETVFEQNYEAEGHGEAAGWKAYYVRGRSFSGATDESASPFSGGLMCYRLYRFPTEKNGWSILNFPAQDKGPLRISFDVMVPENAKSAVTVMCPEWKPWISFSFDTSLKKILTHEKPGHMGKGIPLLDLEPNLWYRLIMEIPEISQKAELFNLVIQKQNYNGQEPSVKTFEGLKLHCGMKDSTKPALGILQAGGSSPDIYIDNIRIEKY